MFMPYIWLLIEVLLNGLFYCMDSGIRCNKRKTKSKNIFQFMDTYRGADIAAELAYLYADALNVIFCTMFFGIGMPIMFPMAIVILVNQAITQKIRIAWICKKPPLLGDGIT